MNQIPRNATLAEALYKDIDKDDYLQEIYGDLLYNYSIKLFHTERRFRDIPVRDALRFADLLSKSTYVSLWKALLFACCAILVYVSSGSMV